MRQRLRRWRLLRRRTRSRPRRAALRRRPRPTLRPPPMTALRPRPMPSLANSRGRADATASPEAEATAEASPSPPRQKQRPSRKPSHRRSGGTAEPDRSDGGAVAEAEPAAEADDSEESRARRAEDVDAEEPSAATKRSRRTARAARDSRRITWPSTTRGGLGSSARRHEAALGERVAMEHVGSTSVPGLAAKPRIDMLLAVADPRSRPPTRRRGLRTQRECR